MDATDDDWALLRAAVPGFAAEWESIVSSAYYDPTLAGPNLAHLARYLVEQLARGEAVEYERACAAVEELYVDLPEEKANYLLTVGFLEDLINDAEQRRLSLRVLYRPLRPHSRAAWNGAYRYTHDGRSWPTHYVA